MIKYFLTTYSECWFCTYLFFFLVTYSITLRAWVQGLSSAWWVYKWTNNRSCSKCQSWNVFVFCYNEVRAYITPNSTCKANINAKWEESFVKQATIMNVTKSSFWRERVSNFPPNDQHLSFLWVNFPVPKEISIHSPTQLLNKRIKNLPWYWRKQ